MVFESLPKVIHGNGPSRLLLNTLANYVTGTWSAEDGCIDCLRDTIDLKILDKTPLVLMAVFIEELTPFMDEFWDKLVKLDYDKTLIHLFIYNSVEYHEKHAAEFVKFWRESNELSTYHSIEYVSDMDGVSVTEGRNQALDMCVKQKCDFLFVVDAVVQLDNPSILTLLIEQNRAVVAPVLIRPNTLWSNFWGALSSQGFYARSRDYIKIVENKRRGLWNVPYISSCYLVSGSVIRNKATRPSYSSKKLDPDMAFAQSLR